MKKFFFVFLSTILMYVQASAQKPVKVEENIIINYRSIKNIHFDKGSAEIRNIAYPILDIVLDLLKSEWKNYSLQIDGFVDNDEAISKSYLALRRAKIVEDYFVKNGIEKQRIIVNDAGQAKIPDGYEEWREEVQEMMRRVTFILIRK